MNNFVVIFVCLAAGHLCRKIPNFPSSTASALNNFVIFLSLPALILSQVPKLLSNFSSQDQWWIPVSMAWISFGLSFALFYFLGRKLKWSPEMTGALILTAGLGNTSFVGFPLLEALIGSHSLPVGILVDQPGTFLVLSTLGIVTAASFSGSSVDIQTISKRVFTFPPFVALLLSVLWFFLGSQGLDSLSPALDKIASTLVPLTLFAVGFQIRWDLSALRRRRLPLALGLLFKLVLAPLVFILLYFKSLGSGSLAVQVTILESAMASMITSAVVASEFNLDAELANLMVGLSIPVSLLTIPLLNFVLFKS